MSLEKMNRSPWNNLWKEENEETCMVWRGGEEGDNLAQTTANARCGGLVGNRKLCLWSGVCVCV